MVEGYDLAVVPSDAYPGVDIVSAVDAWLRMQGWQPTLPPIGAPIAWDIAAGSRTTTSSCWSLAPKAARTKSGCATRR